MPDPAPPAARTAPSLTTMVSTAIKDHLYTVADLDNLARSITIAVNAYLEGIS